MIKKLLIYNSGGGIGDSIQLFPIIQSLENLFEKPEIYYLGAHENHYLGKLKEYNIKLKTLDLGLKYFGFRWWHLFIAKKNFFKLKLDKFDLIVDCQSKLRNTVILKQIPSKAFYSSTFNNIFCSGLEQSPEDFCSILKTADYNIKNIPKRYFDESARLLPGKNYIGFSLTQGNVYRKKEWPLNKVIKLSEELARNNKIPVFLIEKTDQTYKDKLDNAEQEKLSQLSEIDKLKEKRIREENEARRKLDKIHKNKIAGAERDRLNRLDEAKAIIEKKLKEEEKNRRLQEEQERKEKADETRKMQIDEVNRAKEIERENLKKMEERMSNNPSEEEKIPNNSSEEEKKDLN